MNAKVIIRDNVSRSGNFMLDTDTLENNVLGFQRTYLSILHTAIESQINVDIVFIKAYDNNIDNSYSKLIADSANVLYNLVKNKLDSIYCKVSLDIIEYTDFVIYPTENYGCIIFIDAGNIIHPLNIYEHLKKAARKAELAVEIDRSINESDCIDTLTEIRKSGY